MQPRPARQRLRQRVETDHFLNSVIQWLEAKEGHADTAMVYVADHGESLGRERHTHGMPYSIAPDVQKHVPWVTWLSPSMQTHARSISTGCLQQNMRDKRISHDSYFHSVLGLLDVQTGLHQLPWMCTQIALQPRRPLRQRMPCPADDGGRNCAKIQRDTCAVVAEVRGVGGSAWRIRSAHRCPSYAWQSRRRNPCHRASRGYAPSRGRRVAGSAAAAIP